VTRLPIRLRLTAAFAFAMVIVLAAACLFVYVHLRTDIDDAVTGSLETRAAAAVVLAERGDHLAPDDSGVLSETDESFAQLLGPDGRVLSAVGAVDAPALDGAALRRAARAPVIAERSLPGLDDTTRVLARPVDGRRGLRIVAVGQSLQDRNESLSALIGSFLIAGPLAVLAASIVGYGLATSSLAPVEAMRRRASAISLTGGEERLPLPAAHDEIRRLGETLNAMLDRLRRSFERERRFVADASHELRTPVAIVKTELEGALRTGDYGPEVGHALVAAVEECDRLAQLADDLLVLARAGDGRLPTRPEPLRAWDLLEGTRERFADRAAQHDRAVRIDAAPDLCVLADPLRLRQALGNLLDNALRHGAGDILLAAHRAEGSVELDVGDAGDGFTEGIGDRAFERFTRGDEARSREGAGLGLAIVKAIAEAHGGEVGIVDRGTGAAATIVRIRLPDRTPPMGPPSIFAPAPADEEPRSQAPLM
jgi:signal transduction histidine kinase